MFTPVTFATEERNSFPTTRVSECPLGMLYSATRTRSSVCAVQRPPPSASSQHAAPPVTQTPFLHFPVAQFPIVQIRPRLPAGPPVHWLSVMAVKIRLFSIIAWLVAFAN